MNRKHSFNLKRPIFEFWKFRVRITPLRAFHLVVLIALAARLGVSQTTHRIIPSNPGEVSSTDERPIMMTDRAAARFLDQATWGPSPNSVVQLQRMDIPSWLDWQFNINLSDIPDQPILASNGNANTNRRPVQEAFIQNAVTNDDQLRQRVAFALSEIWVVSGVGTPNAYAFPPYWRILRDNSFGNYRDLIKAVTLNPAMGNYLNMANNNKANPARGTAANENYARELMQLFTLGLTQLNRDGSPVLDQSGNPVPAYTQNDVVNVSNMLTGWTYPNTPGIAPKSNNSAYYIGSMFAVESNHDTSAKTIFGNISIAAGQTAEQDLESLLNALMAQSTMAPFVCQQLIQHLVTSNPSPAYIQRVSSVFLDNGSGTRGDMKAVITAILTDPEARAADDRGALLNPGFGHMREPVLFMTNLLRGLNGTLTATSALYNQTSQLSQTIFDPPTVFSYFSPQYRVPNGLLGPEFELHSTQTVKFRADIVNTALYGRLDAGTKVDLSPFIQFTSGAYSRDPGALLDYISYVFLHHAMSDSLRLAASSAVSGVGTATTAAAALARAQAALYIVLTSSEYQILQ